MKISPQKGAGVTLSYTEDKPGHKRIVEQVADADRLVERLHEIQATRASELFIGVNIEGKQDSELAVGLANSTWAVVHSDPQHTENVYSLGDADAEGDVELRFEQWEVLPRRYFVPVDRAIQAIRTWFMTGTLTSEIEWKHESLLPGKN